MVAEVIKDGFLDRHVPTIRALYKQQRDAMLAALEREMAGLDVTWTRPAGGMFLWVRLPEGMDAGPAAGGRGAQRGLCARCAVLCRPRPTPARCACPS
jgi:2-aminoadipate transaminase